MKIVLAFRKKVSDENELRREETEEIELPSELANMIGIEYVSIGDAIYYISHTEYVLDENKLYFWTKRVVGT